MPDGGGLHDDDRRLVSFLGYGYTIAEAAARLSLSRRTAQRRLRRARATLGVATNAEAAVRVAAAASERPVPPRSLLTPRERQAIALVGRGLTTARIAAELGIADSTVDALVKAAMAKLGGRTRIQAAVLAQFGDDAPRVL